MMKRLFLYLLLAVAAVFPRVDAYASGDKVKTGWGLGPLPQVGYDADNGLNLGLQLNLNNYKDGKLYPNPYSTTYLNFAWYQKGIINLILSHDNRTMIPGVRFCTSIQYCNDNFQSFYGLNGYQSNYSPTLVDGSPAGKFYSTHKQFVNFKVDLVGTILPHLSWEAGYHLVWSRITDPKGGGYYPGCFDGNNFLYSLYGKWGIVPMSQLNGGLSSEVRAGLVFDTRDSESSPSRGLWVEGHVIVAPKFLGSSAHYSKFCVNWRHYVPIVRDKLTFAYRAVYQGFFNNDAPWYMMPYYTVVGPQFDRDGMGGFRTLRGIMLNRIQGLHTGIFNTELRWNFVNFRLLKQDITLCLSGFFEGGKVFKPYDISFDALGTATVGKDSPEYDLYLFYVDNSLQDRMHLSAGGGLRFIFNRNFVIALELGKAFNSTDSRFSNRNQDGGTKPSFYFNTGFTF